MINEAGKKTVAVKTRLPAHARASYEGNSVSVELPAEFLRTWDTSNTVGTEARQEFAAGQDLRILVEKDFKCLKPRDDEDQSEAFANPLESH